MNKGWKKITSQIVHQNPFYVLREDVVKTPANTDGKYYYIDGVMSVTVIAEDSHGKLSLVGQTRYPIGNHYSWEFVTGGMHDNENPLEAAKRELEEETGFRAENWESIGEFYPWNGHSSEQTFVFLAKKLTIHAPRLEETEDVTHKQVTLQELFEMVRNGTISCGMTLAALQKYLLFIGKL